MLVYSSDSEDGGYDNLFGHVGLDDDFLDGADAYDDDGDDIDFIVADGGATRDLVPSSSDPDSDKDPTDRFDSSWCEEHSSSDAGSSDMAQGLWGGGDAAPAPAVAVEECDSSSDHADDIDVLWDDSGERPVQGEDEEPAHSREPATKARLGRGCMAMLTRRGHCLIICCVVAKKSGALKNWNELKLILPRWLQL